MTEAVNLWKLLLDHAKASPARAAVITPDLRIDHAELPDHIAALAAALLAQGFDPHTMTGVALRDNVLHPLLTLTLLCMGTPNISLWSTESKSTHKRLAEQLTIKQVITEHGANTYLLEEHDIAAFALSLADRESNHPDQMLVDRHQNLDIRLFFRTTSGTTGVPKTFGDTLAHIVNQANRAAKNPSRACILRGGASEYDSTRAQHLSSLLGGQTVPILHPFNASKLAAFCSAAGVTEIHSVIQPVSLSNSNPNRLPRIPEGIRWITGGSRVPGDLRRRIMEQVTSELYVVFATSETGGISIATPEEHARWPEGVGYPLPEVEVELRDENGKPVAPGEVGELWVRKYGVVGDGTLSQPGWVCTGDRLSWPEDGPLVFHGRSDDMMIMNGANIFPGPIEDTLSGHPDVKDVIAYPLDSRIHGQIPVAAVVLQAQADVSEVELLRYARDQLHHVAPRKIHFVTEIPRNLMGKAKRSELRALLSKGS